MERPGCQISNCEGKALVAYGNKWICGDCLIKIQEKEMERQNKLMEDIADAD